MMKSVTYTILAFLFMMVPSLAVSATKTSHRDLSGQPITVKSNELTADNKGKIAVFTGKVVARQGELTIYADKLVINYAEKKGDVDKIEAVGNVRIVQLNRTGYASEAVYESRYGRVTLTGSPNPRVVQGQDSISGKVITYFVDDEKSVITGGGDPASRVEAVIHPAASKGNVDKK